MRNVNKRIKQEADKMRAEGKTPKYALICLDDQLKYYEGMIEAFAGAEVFHGLEVVFTPYMNSGEIAIVPSHELTFNDITS
jgi:hypothetical protein